MSLTITGDLVLETEQIKKKSGTRKVTESISNSVIEILDNDEFGFFNTKSKHKFQNEIASTEVTIKKLIELKLAAVEQGKKLKARYKKVAATNDILKTKLLSEIE